MSVPLSSTKLRLPSGFNSLIHGFCYEILKSQPKDIHAFGALYFSNLLDAREGKQIEGEDATHKCHDSQGDSSRQPLQTEEEEILLGIEGDEDYVNIETHSKDDHDDQEEKLRKRDLAATKIQAGVRGMVVRRNLKPTKHEQLLAEDEMKDQSSVKKSDDEDGGEGSVHNDAMTEGIRKNEAATKIQSGIRGMQVRKRMKQKVQLEDAVNDSLLEKSDDDDDDEEEAIDDDNDDENNNEGYNDDDDDDDDDNDKTLQKNRAVDKIQAGYLGMKTRRKMKEIKMERDEENTKDGKSDKDDNEEEDGDGEKQTELEISELLNKSATKIQAGVRGMKTRKELNDRRMHSTQRSYSLSQSVSHLTDPQDEIDKAAAKIQAGVRGMKVRRELRKQQSEGGNKSRGSISLTFNNVDNRDMDELNNAASRIQAGMRGMKVRRDFKRRMSEGGKDILLDNERDKAATRIQAGVKGMKVRRDLKSRRQMTFDDSWRDIEPVEEEDTMQCEEQAIDKELAVARIQDGVRGMRVRKNMSRRRSMGTNALGDFSEPTIEGTFRNLDRDEAATKIQAGLRGMKARQELKKRHLMEQNIGKPWQYGQGSVDLERAATKIQAGIRGMRTRKDLGIQKTLWKTFDADDLGSTDVN